MHRIDPKNLVILVILSIVGFYVTSYVLGKWGD